MSFSVTYYHATAGMFMEVCAHPVLTVLACIALRIFYLLWLHPLADVPGPKLAALTDLWKAYAVTIHRFTSMLHDQHAKYGDVVRIGPNEVSIVAPDDVTVVYGPRTGFTKGPFYDAWSLAGKTQFSDRDETSHARLRREVAAAYSLKHLVSRERYCDACTDLLSGHLDKAAHSDSIIDMSKFIEWYPYDSVSGIAFGKLFGLLENGGDTTGILKILAQGTELVTTVASMSNFGWILPSKPISWLSKKLLGEKGPTFFVGYSTRLVEERQALRESDPIAYEEGKDMLYQFMQSTNPVTAEPLDTQTLISNTLSIIVAGADTTKISVLAFLRYVYMHPPTVERLRKEMDDAIDAGRLSFPVSYAQASRLEFMEACIKEAMRLHPVVGITLQRVVPPGGRVIGGRFYHGGTLVGMSPHEIHHDSRAYCKDAGEWHPERWLEDGRKQELEKYNLSFGQGSRVCLGKYLSLMEMSKLLPTIVYHYDIQIRNPEHSWKVLESWFSIQYDFFCTVAKRKQLS